MDENARAAQLALVAAAETAHTAATITEVTLTRAPHPLKLPEELLAAVAGVTSVSVFQADAYPGLVTIKHNSLTPAERSSLISAALAHNAALVPKLSVGSVEPRVWAANGVAQGAVLVTDSRGSGASGRTVNLRIPAGGSAGVMSDHVVLDVTGQGLLNFGPTTVFTGELEFELYYTISDADPVRFTVRRGT
jgi:hypothetical protein